MESFEKIYETYGAEEPTVGELAAADIRKAEVFKKLGIDFCCGGKKSLKQACEEKNLDVSQVEKELEEASKQKATSKGFDFNRWELDFLADYIYNEHHKYYYDERPVIAALMEKVVSHHCTAHPYLKNLAAWYTTLQDELDAHFLKEENVLFPYIKQLVIAKRTNKLLKEDDIPDIKERVKIIEADHEAAGQILNEISGLTNHYTPPPDACNSFALLYHKLKALEEDLHQHIHLENNILFPKASLLEKELKTGNLV